MPVKSLRVTGVFLFICCSVSNRSVNRLSYMGFWRERDGARERRRERTNEKEGSSEVGSMTSTPEACNFVEIQQRRYTSTIPAP